MGGAPPLVEQSAPASVRNSFDHNNFNAPAPQTPDSPTISLSSAGDPTPKVRDVTPALAVITPQSPPTSCGVPPAQIALGSVCVLLVTIKVCCGMFLERLLAYTCPGYDGFG